LPPPLFRPGSRVTIVRGAPARECLRHGWRLIILPPGTYTIAEVRRDEEKWHIPEESDGYTYRLYATIGERLVRVSVWQNDLADAV
jgi:hypothetical protein